MENSPAYAPYESPTLTEMGAFHEETGYVQFARDAECLICYNTYYGTK